MSDPRPHAQIEESDSILTFTLDRDEKMNAVSPEMTDLLWDAVRTVADRADLRALVIRANGRYFTAGLDLKAPFPATIASTGEHFRRLYRQSHLLFDELEALEKPVVFAAHGPCLGIGVELAGSCDFRFATPNTRFQLPEVTLGMIAGSGGTSRLTRLVGPHWAKWIAMANRSVDADRALSIGLVHEIYPVEDFHQQVHEFVRELVQLPMETLGVAKMAIDMSAEVDATTARRIERLANTSLAQSEEFKARMAAGFGSARKS
jgi:enoyl-CoA hydratase